MCVVAVALEFVVAVPVGVVVVGVVVIVVLVFFSKTYENRGGGV